MKTQELIESLSGELKPFTPMKTGAAFLGQWLALCAAMGLVMYAITPSSGVHLGLATGSFLLESGAWFMATLAAVLVVRRSALPGISRTSDRWIAATLLAAVALLIYSRLSWNEMPEQVAGEMHFYAGRCAAFILTMGTLSSLLLIAGVRKLAPTRPVLTAVWISIASGAAGAFIMQFFCVRENPVHLFLWHGLPIVALSLLGAAIGNKALRW